jgi:uncharacterized protein
VDNLLINQLSQVNPEDRIVLLPHCLRPSQTCQAKYNQTGLQCISCNPECTINRLRSAAVRYGYKGVCIAPGGKLAIKFVRESSPKAIVAIACDKELSEGIQEIKNLTNENKQPVVIIVPLIKDGCVDTEVDTQAALNIIGAGCAGAEDKI